MTTDNRWIREKTLNPEMCKRCKGRCCKQCGCSYFPEDLDMTFENIVKNIKEREISIDRMEYLENFYSKLEKPIYYLRVANENESYLAYGNIGRCIFLSDNGCKLDYEARPSGGKFIVPFWSGCYPLYTKQEFIEKWIPYQNLLKNLIEFFS